MIIPNLLNPALLAGAGPRGLALPNLMATPNPLSNPALVNQLQQIQRLHAQNSRLIGKSGHLGSSRVIRTERWSRLKLVLHQFLFWHLISREELCFSYFIIRQSGSSNYIHLAYQYNKNSISGDPTLNMAFNGARAFDSLRPRFPVTGKKIRSKS